jgi:hypothetical protein
MRGVGAPVLLHHLSPRVIDALHSPIDFRANIQTTQRYADYCPNPGERDIVEAAFARGTNRGTNLREPDASQSA